MIYETCFKLFGMFLMYVLASAMVSGLLNRVSGRTGIPYVAISFNTSSNSLGSHAMTGVRRML